MASKYSKETMARISSGATMSPIRVGMIMAVLERTPEQVQLRKDAEYGRRMRELELAKQTIGSND